MYRSAFALALGKVAGAVASPSGWWLGDFALASPR